MSGFALSYSNNERQWRKMKQSDNTLVITKLSYFGYIKIFYTVRKFKQKQNPPSSSAPSMERFQSKDRGNK